jgi:hypothetical protein
MGRLPVRLPSYVAAGVLSEHANAGNTVRGATAASGADVYYSNIVPNGNIVSATITLSKKCMVVVTSLVIINSSSKATDIQRGGVNITEGTTISSSGFAIYGYYGHLQYATEVLDPGTYTYNLVNTSGASRTIYGAAIKIVAVACS